MDFFSFAIEDIDTRLQAFNNNNRILMDNWKDSQASQFSQSILNEMNLITIQMVHLLETVRTGIEPKIQQIEEMRKELAHINNIEFSHYC